MTSTGCVLGKTVNCPPDASAVGRMQSFNRKCRITNQICVAPSCGGAARSGDDPEENKADHPEGWLAGATDPRNKRQRSHRLSERATTQKWQRRLGHQPIGERGERAP